MKTVDGLISVSSSYIDDLKTRYPEIKNVPGAVITFGYFARDLEIARQHKQQFEKLLNKGSINLVYIGRGGADMHAAVTPLFNALNQYLKLYPENAAKLKLYFIGTSYAPAGTGVATIKPLAEALGVAANVIEVSDRISYYHTLATLQQADALFIPGSDDPKYTASKLYPYLLTAKPLLAIFNPASPALKTLHSCGADNAYGYNDANLQAKLVSFITALLNGELPNPIYNHVELDKHSALNMTQQQCALFEQALNRTKP